MIRLNAVNVINNKLTVHKFFRKLYFMEYCVHISDQKTIKTRGNKYLKYFSLSFIFSKMHTDFFKKKSEI